MHLNNSRLVVVAWDNFSDYHHDRINSSIKPLRENGLEILGLEFVRNQKNHAWASPVRLGCPIITIQDNGYSSFMGLVFFWFRVMRKLLMINPDVIFIPSYWPLRSALTLISARLLGIPSVMMNDSHGGTSCAKGVAHWAKLLLIKLYSAGFVAGKPQLRFFRGMGFSESALFSGYDTINGKYFADMSVNNDFNAKLELKFKLPVDCILSLGRLIPKKNLSLIIRAYAKACWALEGAIVPLVIVGDGPEQESLISLVHDLSLTPFFYSADTDFRGKRGCVCFYPFCTNSETAYFYGTASVFILASKREEWGLVVNEAIASGTPVLVSESVGCVEDLVFNGVNGFSFSPTDIDGLAKLILGVAGKSDLNEKLRVGAKSMLHKLLIEVFPEAIYKCSNYVLRENARLDLRVV